MDGDNQTNFACRIPQDGLDDNELNVIRTAVLESSFLDGSRACSRKRPYWRSWDVKSRGTSRNAFTGITMLKSYTARRYYFSLR